LARTLDGDIIQHSFWLFDDEEHARAEATSVRCATCPTRRQRS
jgi:hypothetical protein